MVKWRPGPFLPIVGASHEDHPVTSPLPTFFLPAERCSIEEIRSQNERFAQEQAVCDTLHHVPNLVLILNKERQVVYANIAAAKMLDSHCPEDLLGGRFGEAWGCVHATETPGGCGTSEACRYCGAANAKAKGLAGKAATEECRLMIRREGRDEAVDLRVWAKPLAVGGEEYLFFTAVDIADEKRKAFLERIFLHDILNTASALKGFTNLLGMDGVSLSKEDMIQRIGDLSVRMVDEINAHRLLLAAENNELELQPREIGALQLLKSVMEAYDRPETLENRRIEIAPDCDDVGIRTDPTLLSRVVGNMTKNALEASVPGETVTMGCRSEGDQVAFWVHNRTYMPENIRLQVFNRSFSTKGSGRGLGTYSMKFLTERYLGGRISFASTESGGTVFTARYPCQLPALPEGA